jgi:hypothetical protein
MDLLIMCPQWGQEHMPVEDFFFKVKNLGYDGVDTWLPEDAKERSAFISLLNQYDLKMVSHQHQAFGNNINAFCRSMEYYLNISMESEPLVINSHSGRDYFSLDEQLQVIDTAQEFAVLNNIEIGHETHRGRIGFSPYNAHELFKLRPEMKITADFSHWVCVTESHLENCEIALNEGIDRAVHVHARVGHSQGPQIPHPAIPTWKPWVDLFMQIWGEIIARQQKIGCKNLTITTEFGPPPYMWTHPEDGSPLVDQWEVNVYMKELLRNTFEPTKLI